MKNMRLIKSSEIKEISYEIAKAFIDYPLYSEFFPDDDKKLKRVHLFFWVRLVTRKKCTYINNDKTLVCSILAPDEKELPFFVAAITNPGLIFQYLKYIRPKHLRTAREFSAIDKDQKKRCYDPKKDYYVQMVAVINSPKTIGPFRNFIVNIDHSIPYYCETHTPENEKLYKFLNFKTVDTVYWRGIPQFAMKREPEETVEGDRALYHMQK